MFLEGFLLQPLMESLLDAISEFVVENLWKWLFALPWIPLE